MPTCPNCNNYLSEYQNICNKCGDSHNIMNCISNIKAAEDGDIDAMDVLGAMYRHGIYVDQDYSQALYWTKQAAEKGSSHAQGALGFTYYEGTGVEINYETAYYWFRKAALNGVPVAKFFVGYFLLGIKDPKNRGVQANEKKALYWLVQAKHDGDQDAIVMLDRLGVDDAVFLDEDILLEITYKQQN